jgi:hypothetical protein
MIVNKTRELSKVGGGGSFIKFDDLSVGDTFGGVLAKESRSQMYDKPVYHLTVEKAVFSKKAQCKVGDSIMINSARMIDDGIADIRQLTGRQFGQYVEIKYLGVKDKKKPTAKSKTYHAFDVQGDSSELYAAPVAPTTPIVNDASNIDLD